MGFSPMERFRWTPLSQLKSDPLLHTPEEALRKAFNFITCFNMMRALSPHLLANNDGSYPCFRASHCQTSLGRSAPNRRHQTTITKADTRHSTARPGVELSMWRAWKGIVRQISLVRHRVFQVRWVRPLATKQATDISCEVLNDTTQSGIKKKKTHLRRRGNGERASQRWSPSSTLYSDPRRFRQAEKGRGGVNVKVGVFSLTVMTRVPSEAYDDKLKWKCFPKNLPFRLVCLQKYRVAGKPASLQIQNAPSPLWAAFLVGMCPFVEVLGVDISTLEPNVEHLVGLKKMTVRAYEKTHQSRSGSTPKKKAHDFTELCFTKKKI